LNRARDGHPRSTQLDVSPLRSMRRHRRNRPKQFRRSDPAEMGLSRVPIARNRRPPQRHDTPLRRHQLSPVALSRSMVGTVPVLQFSQARIGVAGRTFLEIVRLMAFAVLRLCPWQRPPQLDRLNICPTEIT